jgi:hypothetical protein
MGIETQRAHAVRRWPSAQAIDQALFQLIRQLVRSLYLSAVGIYGVIEPDAETVPYDAP